MRKQEKGRLNTVIWKARIVSAIMSSMAIHCIRAGGNTKFKLTPEFGQQSSMSQTLQ